MFGEGATDEAPVDPHGNPHPMPQQENFHPNKHNHFLGPLHHLEHDDMHKLPDLNLGQPQLDLQVAPPVIPDEDMDMEED